MTFAREEAARTVPQLSLPWPAPLPGGAVDRPLGRRSPLVPADGGHGRSHEVVLGGTAAVAP